MKLSVSNIIIFAAAVTLMACADKKDEKYSEIEQRAFDTWMELHVNTDPSNPVAERLENGMYVQWLDRGAVANQLNSGDWFTMNYTGTTLPDKYMNGRGRVFMTRDSLVAKQENTFSPYTHYVPQRSLLKNTQGFPSGVYDYVLKIMRKGDKARIFLPASKANSLSAFRTTNGYGGSYGASTGVAMIIDSLEIVDIIGPDPITWEFTAVENYAKNEWGMNIESEEGKVEIKNEKTGNVTALMFYQIITENYSGQNPTGEKPILKDEDDNDLNPEVYLWYAGKFMDEFLFDTNVDSIGTRFRRNISAYDTLDYKIGSGNLIPAFDSLFKRDVVPYDSHCRMILSSALGYPSGNYNSSSTSVYTEIQRYEPIIFDVWVGPKPEEEED